MVNRIWPTAVVGEADSVSSVSALVYVRVEAFDRSLRLFWASTFGSYFMPKVEGPLTEILGENKAIFSLQCLFSKLNQLEDSLQNERN